MPTHEEILSRLTKPKPFPKSASEEHIFAAKAKAQTTAALVAEVKKGQRQ